MIIKKLEEWYTKKKVTDITTIIGNTGYGKTYCAGKLEEIYMENEWPMVIIDKMGIHFVVRAEYDKLVILGGDHGDYSLDDIDKLLPMLLDNNINFLLDLSNMNEMDMADFVEGFFEYMYEWHKQKRLPKNYVIEECDAFIGQSGSPKGVKNMVTKCITKGRMNGFGFTLLSQRYRMIDKTPLGQTKNYIVFNMKYPLDLSTLAKLIGEDVSSKVRRLKIGQCLIMNDEGYDKYNVGKKKSPDEAMTPEVDVELEEVEIKPLNEEVRSLLEYE